MVMNDKAKQHAAATQPAVRLQSDLDKRLRDTTRPVPYSVLKAYRRLIESYNTGDRESQV